MPTISHSALDERFQLETFLSHRLEIVTKRVVGVFADNYGRSFKLTISEWRVLAAIARHGTLSPTVAGRHTAMDKVKVSRAAQSLAAKRLIRQTQDPRDGRGRLLRLTRKGTTAYDGMVLLATRLEAEVFSSLSKAELTALDRILTKISSCIETKSGAAEPDSED